MVLEEKAEKLLQRGLGTLNTFLEQLKSSMITVGHIRAAEKHRDQLLSLCAAMDGVQASSTVTSNLREEADTMLRDCMSILESLATRKHQLSALFDLCASLRIG